MIKIIYDKEYHTFYELYTYFSCDKSEYYFMKEEYTYFKNFKLEELKNEKTL